MLLSIVLISQRRSVRESGFPVRRARPSAWPGRAHGVQFLVCPLPLEDVWTSAEFPEIHGEIHEDKTAHFRPHACSRDAPGARRRGYVVIQQFPQRSGREAIRPIGDTGMAGPSPAVVGAF